MSPECGFIWEIRASVIGPWVSIPHVVLRHVAGLVLLSVIGVREPPHDAVRRSGRADLSRVVRSRRTGHSRICGFTRSMRPRDGTVLPGWLALPAAASGRAHARLTPAKARAIDPHAVHHHRQFAGER